MKRMRDFLKPYNFIAAKPSSNSTKIIENFVNLLDINSPLAPDEYHVTLIYDEDPTVSKKATNPVICSAEVAGVKILGERGSRWEAVVLMLESDTLRERQKELLKMGFNTSYPKYLPHLSIKYMPQDVDRERLKEYEELFKNTRISLNSEIWER